MALVGAGAEPVGASAAVVGAHAAAGKGRGPRPGRAWDITAILVSWFGGLLLIGEAAEIRGLSDDAVFLHFVAGCLLSLALWWRSSHPVPVAVVLLVASVITDAAGLATLIALYTVVARRRGRIIVVLTLLNLVGGLAYAALYPDPAVPHLVSFLLTVAILATTIAVGVAARSRRELVDSLRERAVRAEEEVRLRADRLRALERERIAREMHDSLAHRISMVSLHAGALQIRPDLTPEEVATAAATIRDSAHQALEDLREILGVLRAGPGDALRPQPDLRHLDELVADARKAGVPVTAANRLDGLPVGASLGRTVYRLVQEGLTNAGKHAPGSPVTLLLERTDDGDLHVRVSNPLSPLTRAAPLARRPTSSRATGEPGDEGSTTPAGARRTTTAGVMTGGPTGVSGGAAAGVMTGVSDGAAAGAMAGGPTSVSGGTATAVRRGGMTGQRSDAAADAKGSAAAGVRGSGPAGASGGGVTDVRRGAAVGVTPSASSDAAAGVSGGAAVDVKSRGAAGAKGSGAAGVSGGAATGQGSTVPGAGSGLVGLAERVDLLDGRLRHGVHGDPRVGLTFDLEAWLPWPAPAEAAAREAAAG